MTKKFITRFGLAVLIGGISLFVVGCGSKAEEPPAGSINTGPPVDASGQPIPPEDAVVDSPKKGAKGGGGP